MKQPKQHRARYVLLRGDGPTAKADVRRHYLLSWDRRPFAVIRHESGWLACNFACLWWVLFGQGRTPMSPTPDERRETP